LETFATSASATATASLAFARSFEYLETFATSASATATASRMGSLAVDLPTAEAFNSTGCPYPCLASAASRSAPTPQSNFGLHFAAASSSACVLVKRRPSPETGETQVFYVERSLLEECAGFSPVLRGSLA